ncbi:MAG: hypothetical protein RI907_921 [Pseudomonadota bacterium]|jgi:4-hydroxymandelate oxidase
MTLLHLREQAQARLPEALWQHLQQGAHDAGAPAPSEFDAQPLTPRPLRALGHGHTSLQLWGQTWAHPLIVAPLAYAGLFHADGECGLAMAAAAQGGVSVTSSLASQPFSDVAQAHRHGQAEPLGAAPDQAPWFQLYWQGSRERTQALLQRALDAGSPVVVFTVDAPIKLAGLELPPHVRAVNLPPAPTGPAAPTTGEVFGHWMAQAPTWDDLVWLRSQCAQPLLVKGILHPDDAQAALQAGCDGLVVSSHGGRVLSGCPPVLRALTAIRQRVGPQVPLLLDSGIRSGRDAFVALQSGATAVMVGRPCLWGLAAQGALGVAQALRILRDELAMTMALMGCATLADIPESGLQALGRSDWL